MKHIFKIVVLLASVVLNAEAQQPLQREVTLYNPYKPTLNEARKRSFLPEISDTSRFRPSFSYDVRTNPFMPSYEISPIKAATLQPDPLNKLYRSYVNLGFGTNNSPLAEVSITNERSKKGALGFYGRHFSTNGSFTNDANQKIYAGQMDNELALFGKKFYREGVFGGSVDYSQKTRHAYGFIPENQFNISRKQSKLNYGNLGADLYIESARLDSSDFEYNFNLSYDYFYNTSDFQFDLTSVNPVDQHSIEFTGMMAKLFKGFYAGASLDIGVYNPSAILFDRSKFVGELNPFVARKSDQWDFRLGFRSLVARSIEESGSLHIYPDVRFGFSIVQSYINFFTTLSGGLDRNKPQSVIDENPFLLPAGMLYTDIPFTDNKLTVTAGLKGNTGLEGTYEVSASYSLVEDMVFYTNLFTLNPVYGSGNFFHPLLDDVDLLRLHGSMSGKISEKMSFTSALNLYNYTMTRLDVPVNKPSWDANFGLKYNLRDKIIAGVELNAIGERKMSGLTTMPVHVNMNLLAEYRYSRILSFWTRINEISYQRYYEWSNYPSHMFQFMVGFTYSL